MNSSHFKTKIVAGRLVTVPVHNDMQPVSHQSNNHQNWFHDFDRNQGQNHARLSNGLHNDHHKANENKTTLYNARLEAQRNKARAMHQTYHSVLDAHPDSERRDITSQSRILSTNPLVLGVVSGIVSQSRHKLLSTMSSMRRRDPQESGVLTMYDVADVLDLHNVAFNQRTKSDLLEQFMMVDGMVDYRNMWQFVMDCYTKKDEIDIPTREYNQPQYEQQQEHNFNNNNNNNNNIHQQQYSYPRSHSPADTTFNPGLQTQLEHQLRQYARTNQRKLETNLLEEMFRTLDRYGTGKLLKSQVGRLCQQYLQGIDGTVLSAILSTCDSTNSGLVDYQQLINILKTSQPTYLPPLDTSPPKLVSSPSHQNAAEYGRFMDEEKEILNYLTRLSSPPRPSPKMRHGNEAIPTGHSQELEKIGSIGFHLSDFETEIHKEKVYSSSQAPTPEPERPGTYDLGPRPGTYDLKQRDEESEDKQCSGEENHSSSTPRKSPKTPRSGGVGSRSSLRTPKRPATSTKVTPFRRKWGDHSPRKLEKWWKEKELSDRDNNGDRKTWGQSGQIKTVRGKRRKKLKKLNSKTGHKNTNSETSTTTDFDSEAYTTTDIEIGSSVSDDIRANFLNPCNGVTKKKSGSSSLNGGGDNNVSSDSDFLSPRKNVTKLRNGSPFRCHAEDGGVDETLSRDQYINQEEHQEKDDENTVTEPMKTIVDEITTGVDEIMKLESLSPTNCVAENGAVFLDVKESKYKLFPPTNKKTKIERPDVAIPNKALQLDWVYGFDGEVLALSPTQCVFTCGRVAVVMDTDKNKQRFFRKHTKDITSCSTLPDEKIVATAQQWDGKKCIIYVWSAVDMATISCIYADTFEDVVFKKMVLRKENILLALVESLGRGHVEQYLCLYNIKDNELLTTWKLSHTNGISFHSDTINIATYGKSENPLAFYRYDSGSFVSKPCSFGTLPVPKVITCALFNHHGNLITGDSNGTIYLWLTSTGQIDHVVNGAHTSWITSMCMSKKGYLLTGCSRENCVKVWSAQLKECTSSLKINDYIGIAHLSISNESVYISTTSNDILKVELKDNDDPLQGNKESVISEGHSDVITGLVEDPVYKEMMTSLSADGTLHTYNTETKCIVSKSVVKGNGSCIAYHPSKEYLFVGCQDGSIHLLASVTGSFVGKFKDIYCTISIIKISQDGSKVACGAMDGTLLVYLFDEQSKMLELTNSVKFFNDTMVKHVDWNVQNDTLRVESVTSQICYYDIGREKIIENRPDLLWSSSSCCIVYEKKGLWEDKFYDIDSTITSVPASSNNNIMALAYKEKVVLHKYPMLSCDDKKVFTTSGCVSSHAPSNIRFSCDGGILYMTYNKSGCLWQWKIVEK